MAAKLIKATVAAGRTVHHEDKRAGPGEVVELLDEEVKRLTALGFLVDAKAPAAAAPAVEGATVRTEDGVSLKAG